MKKKKILLYLSFFIEFIIGIHLGYQRTSPRIIEISPKTMLIFLSGGSTTADLQKKEQCKYTINGSYFGKNKDGSFFPAGERFTTTGNQHYTKSKKSDPNLQETLSFDQKNGEIRLFISEDEVLSTGIQVFNAGPWLIKSGSPNPTLTQNISHRNAPYARTTIAKKEGKSFLILFTKRTPLSQVTNQLLKLGFDDAINLDGGPSTAISSSDWINGGFNEQEKLPILFCIK